MHGDESWPHPVAEQVNQELGLILCLIEVRPVGLLQIVAILLTRWREALP
jgi:hypothetical protein